MSDRIKKLEKRLREHISSWAVSHAGDFPALVLITIQSIRISKDLSHAKIAISCAQDANESVQCLNENAPAIRHYLSKKLSLPRVPKLYFVIDQLHAQLMKAQAVINKHQ